MDNGACADDGEITLLSLHAAHDNRVAVAPSNRITALWSETNNHRALPSCHRFVFQRFTINPLPAFPLFLSLTLIPHLTSQSPLFIAQGTEKKSASVMSLASILSRWPWPTSEGLSSRSMTSINTGSNEEAAPMIGWRDFLGEKC